MNDENELTEKGISSASPKKSNITLQEAIDFGEYDPKALANFAEWHDLSPHIQWQLIRKALEIRHKQLITQYAELNNVLDLSKKPHIREAMRSVEKQLSKLMEDKEALYVEYSNKI
jgi:hypothetical protein